MQDTKHKRNNTGLEANGDLDRATRIAQLSDEVQRVTRSIRRTIGTRGMRALEAETKSLTDDALPEETSNNKPKVLIRLMAGLD